MQVRILEPRAYQHAGVERPLTVGQVYDLPAVVAASLVRRGLAAAVDPVLKAPEHAMASVPEQKARGRR